MAIVFSVAGLVLFLLGWPLLLKKVPQNVIYGLRTRATLDSKKVWYRANARAGLCFIVLGALLALVVQIMAASGAPGDLIAAVGSGIILVGAGLLTIHGVNYAAQLAKAEEVPPAFCEEDEIPHSIR